MELATLLAVSFAAALSSILGGLIALWQRPTTLFMSASLGFASGVLIGTIAFEMMPEATDLGSVAIVAAGFACGFAAIYGVDLFVHRGQLAGTEAEQRRKVRLYYRRRRPRASDVTVLAGGTSAEEIVEGIAIGAGTVVQPSIGLLVGLAIAIDNLSEGLSIGELLRTEVNGRTGANVREIIGWTSTIGIALVSSSVAGWLLLRDVPDVILSLLLATGAGGMFYLTVTDLLPKAEARQYQESSAIATGLGFLLILVISSQI